MTLQQKLIELTSTIPIQFPPNSPSFLHPVLRQTLKIWGVAISKIRYILWTVHLAMGRSRSTTCAMSGLFASSSWIWYERSLTSERSIRFNRKKKLTDLDLHQKVANEIILEAIASLGRGPASLKQIRFLSNHIVYNIAPLNNSTNNLSFDYN